MQLESRLNFATCPRYNNNTGRNRYYEPPVTILTVQTLWQTDRHFIYVSPVYNNKCLFSLARCKHVLHDLRKYNNILNEKVLFPTHLVQECVVWSYGHTKSDNEKNIPDSVWFCNVPRTRDYDLTILSTNSCSRVHKSRYRFDLEQEILQTVSKSWRPILHFPFTMIFFNKLVIAIIIVLSIMPTEHPQSH